MGITPPPVEEAIGRIRSAMMAEKKDPPACKKIPAITQDTFGMLDMEVSGNNLNWNLFAGSPFARSKTVVEVLIALKNAAFYVKALYTNLIDQQRSFNNSVTQSINILRDLAVYQDHEIRLCRAKLDMIESSLSCGSRSTLPYGPVEDHFIIRQAPPGEKVSGRSAIRNRPGSREEARESRKAYIEYFKDKGAVLDACCGRGEFLELLIENGFDAIGVDIDGEAVDFCRGRGLPAIKSDILDYLSSLEDESLDGIFSSRAIEYFTPAYLVDFIKLSYAKLKPSGIIIFDAVRPRWPTSRAFATGISRVGPIHPSTIRFLLEVNSFINIRSRYSNSVEDAIIADK